MTRPALPPSYQLAPDPGKYTTEQLLWEISQQLRTVSGQLDGVLDHLEGVGEDDGDAVIQSNPEKEGAR